MKLLQRYKLQASLKPRPRNPHGLILSRAGKLVAFITESFLSFLLTISQKDNPRFHFNDMRNVFFLFQIAELNIRHEQEKAQTLRAHQIERDSSLKEHEQDKVSKVPPCHACFQTFTICNYV